MENSSIRYFHVEMRTGDENNNSITDMVVKAWTRYEAMDILETYGIARVSLDEFDIIDKYGDEFELGIFYTSKEDDMELPMQHITFAIDKDYKTEEAAEKQFSRYHRRGETIDASMYPPKKERLNDD